MGRDAVSHTEIVSRMNASARSPKGEPARLPQLPLHTFRSTFFLEAIAIELGDGVVRGIKKGGMRGG